LGEDDAKHREVHQILRHVPMNQELNTETVWPTQPDPTTSQQV
jgi:hypothetical protein